MRSQHLSRARLATLAGALLAPACLIGCATNSLIDGMRPDVQDELYELARADGSDLLITAVYGPEWETLWITDRRIIDGTLRCVHYEDVPYWEPDALANGVTLYETSRPKDLQTFRELRETLLGAKRVPWDGVRTSNPAYKMLILDRFGQGVDIVAGSSTKGALWFSENTILAAEAVGMFEGTAVAPSDWALAEDYAERRVRRSGYDFVPSTTFFSSVFLDYFDIYQRLAWQAAVQSETSKSSPKSAE